jgi:hypothetical protein
MKRGGVRQHRGFLGSSSISSGIQGTHRTVRHFHKEEGSSTGTQDFLRLLRNISRLFTVTMLMVQSSKNAHDVRLCIYAAATAHITFKDFGPNRLVAHGGSEMEPASSDGEPRLHLVRRNLHGDIDILVLTILMARKQTGRLKVVNTQVHICHSCNTSTLGKGKPPRDATDGENPLQPMLWAPAPACWRSQWSFVKSIESWLQTNFVSPGNSVFHLHFRSEALGMYYPLLTARKEYWHIVSTPANVSEHVNVYVCLVELFATSPAHFNLRLVKTW